MKDGDWTFAKESPVEHVHGLHPYPARMHPPVAKKAIQLFTRKSSSKTSLVFDPFCGSGGVLVEARLQRHNSIGIDINPLGVLLAKVKSTPINPFLLSKAWNVVNLRISSFFKERWVKGLIKSLRIYNRSLYTKATLSRFLSREVKSEEIIHKIQRKLKDRGVSTPDISSTNALYWFKPTTIVELALIKTSIEKALEETDEDYKEKIKDFMYACFSRTVREVSGTRSGEFKLYRRRLEKWLVFEPDTRKKIEEIVTGNIGKMAEFYDFCKRSNAMDNIFSRPFFGDTRKIFTKEFPLEARKILYKGLESNPEGKVDLIVTSPPYGDSPTTVAYGQFSRYSLLWLGYPKKLIYEIDKISLGGKKNNIEFEVESPSLIKTLKGINSQENKENSVNKKSNKRTKEVKSFFIDLYECLKALSKVMKDEGILCFVLGNRTVKKVQIPTDKILAEFGEDLGLKYVDTFRRKIAIKRIPWKSSPSNIVGDKVSTIGEENIVILKKS